MEMVEDGVYWQTATGESVVRIRERELAEGTLGNLVMNWRAKNEL